MCYHKSDPVHCTIHSYLGCYNKAKLSYSMFNLNIAWHKFIFTHYLQDISKWKTRKNQFPFCCKNIVQNFFLRNELSKKEIHK